MNAWQYFMQKTKEYFSPLKKAWFWKYVFPVLVILSAAAVYFEEVKPLQDREREKTKTQQIKEINIKLNKARRVSMEKVNLEELEVGDRVYYVAAHLTVTLDNAEKGFVTKILGDKVWVRYLGPQGNLTRVQDLYK